MVHQALAPLRTRGCMDIDMASAGADEGVRRTYSARYWSVEGGKHGLPLNLNG